MIVGGQGVRFGGESKYGCGRRRGVVDDQCVGRFYVGPIIVGVVRSLRRNLVNQRSDGLSLFVTPLRSAGTGLGEGPIPRAGGRQLADDTDKVNRYLPRYGGGLSIGQGNAPQHTMVVENHAVDRFDGEAVRSS